MTHTPGRYAGAAAALCLLATGWTSCGLLDGSSRIEEALEYLPAGSATVTFVDRAALGDRDDEPYGHASDAGVDAFGDAVSTEVQVEWEATATFDQREVHAWKLDDDTDFDEVARDLDGSPVEATVRLVPDEHLVVAGDIDLAVAVAADEVDSLADDGSFGELLDEAPDQDGLEYAAMSLVSACGPSALFVATDDVVRSVTTSEDDASTEDTDFAERETAYRGWLDRVGIFACELPEPEPFKP